MNKKLWSGRFAATTHEAVDDFTASISFDQALWFEDIMGNLAHVRMLEACHLLTPDESEKIQAGLKIIAQKIHAGEIHFSKDDEDIHMNIERLLTEMLGDVAKKLHTARSRNDQIALDLRLYLRKQLLKTIALLLSLQKILLQLAKNHQDVLIPGYTHLQRAQPIFLAQYWLAYASMLARDINRLQEMWPRLNLSPLGACALNGTSLPIDRAHVANSLAFDGIALNTLDAVSDRDFIIEFLSNAALLMMHLSRLSEELVLWASQEFNFISFDDAFCTGSSIMPQKKNPDVVELGRGKTGRVYGSLITLLTIMKGLPLAYNKDLQEDKEPLFDTVKTVQQTLSIYSDLLASLKINEANMKDATEVGFLNATILADFLVEQGVPFRKAHEVIGRIVAYATEKNIAKLEELSLAEWQAFSMHFTDEVYNLITPKTAARRCDALPSGESALARQCALLEKNLERVQTWWQERADKVKRAMQLG